MVPHVHLSPCVCACVRACVCVCACVCVRVLVTFSFYCPFNRIAQSLKQFIWKIVWAFLKQQSIRDKKR